LLSACRSGAPGLPRSGPLTWLLHRLCHALRAAPQGFQCLALRADGAFRIAVAELALGLTHRLAGLAKLIHAVLALLALLSHAALLQLLEQLLQLLAQGLLILAQFAHALLALLALLTLLSAMAIASLILSLPERAVAQLLLLADHVAELVERLHHVVAVFAILLARPRHLQIFKHLLQFLQ